MKKISSIFFAVLVLTCSIFTGCEKEEDSNPPANNSLPNNPTPDTIPPVIVVSGADTVIVSLNSSFTDAGATATDDIDGAVIVISDGSSTNPNVNLAGTYMITYSAEDSAGNQATATRMVIVRNDAYYLEGNYIVTDTCGVIVFNYTQTITASNVVNDRIHFNKFADYSNNSGIFADVNGSSINLPAQVANNIGSFSEDHQFNGAGSFVTSPNVVIQLAYVDINISASVSATCIAWFVKL